MALHTDIKKKKNTQSKRTELNKKKKNNTKTYKPLVPIKTKLTAEKYEQILYLKNREHRKLSKISPVERYNVALKPAGQVAVDAITFYKRYHITPV